MGNKKVFLGTTIVYLCSLFLIKLTGVMIPISCIGLNKGSILVKLKSPGKERIGYCYHYGVWVTA